MRSGRREFLAGVGAVASLGSLLPLPNAAAQVRPAPRMRLEEFVTSPGRVEALKRGVAAMKARRPSDPKSWFFQAAVHGVSDLAIVEAERADPAVRAVVSDGRFWNKCPHHGEPSADFLLWHRAYLFYFERILREASGDPSLSVPYWNYNDPAQRAFPGLFADADRADPRDPDSPARNPLFDERREASLVAGVTELSERAVSLTAVMNERDFFGVDETQGVAGAVADQLVGTQGLLERRPHNGVHFAIGGVIGTGDLPPASTANAGLMADPETAAFDPVFWVHHSNVDRLWRVWDCLPERHWGQLPARSWFNERPWHFHDVSGTVRNEARLFYLKDGNLPDVRFDSGDQACTPLSAQDPFPVAVAGGGASAAVRITFDQREELGAVQEPLALSAERPVQANVPFSVPVAGDASPARRLERAAPQRPRRVVLELAGVSYSSPPSVGYDVFVNLPEGTEADPNGPYFVGSLALFGTKHDGAGPHAGHGTADGSLQQFDITSQMRATTSDPSRVKVSIVPFDLLTSRRADASPPRRDGGVRVREMRVLLTEGASRPN